MPYLYASRRHSSTRSLRQVKPSPRLPRKCFPPIQEEMEKVLPLPDVRKRPPSPSSFNPSKKPKADWDALPVEGLSHISPTIRLNHISEISVIWDFSYFFGGNAPLNAVRFTALPQINDLQCAFPQHGTNFTPLPANPPSNGRNTWVGYLPPYILFKVLKEKITHKECDCCHCGRTPGKRYINEGNQDLSDTVGNFFIFCGP